jgi:hypothetical protein
MEYPGQTLPPNSGCCQTTDNPDHKTNRDRHFRRTQALRATNPDTCTKLFHVWKHIPVPLSLHCSATLTHDAFPQWLAKIGAHIPDYVEIHGERHKMVDPNCAKHVGEHSGYRVVVLEGKGTVFGVDVRVAGGSGASSYYGIGACYLTYIASIPVAMIVVKLNILAAKICTEGKPC